MRIGSLCSGYGGLDLAVEAVTGGRTAWVSDIDKGACKVLAHRFPDAPNIGDMTAVDWLAVEPVDVLTGGTPCQDLSHAGKRAGMTEGTRSNLWVSMREAIATIRPGLVVWENVEGAASAAADSEVELCPGCMGDRPSVSLRALGRVVGDLSSLGYVGCVRAVRASDVGAPHRRTRRFLVAVVADAGCEQWERRSDTIRGGAAGRHTPGQHRRPTTAAETQLSDTNGAGQHGDGGLDLRTAVSLLPTPTQRDHKDHTIRREPHRPDDVDTLARALTLLPTPAVNDMGAAYTPDEWDAWTDRMKAKHGNGNGHGASLAIEAQRLLPTPMTAYSQRDPDKWLDERPAGNGQRRAAVSDLEIAAKWEGQWGQYAAAIARWESLTRIAPPPTEAGPKGNPRLSPAFTEWMMGLPAGWITDVPGVTRNEALKLCGNGVVPQQAEAALRFLLPIVARIEVAA